MIKRLLDFILALIAIFLLTPVYLIIFFLVLIKLQKPVFFKQTRPGLDGKSFMLLKFRTMTEELDVNGDLLADSKRLTKFGRFLRSTSLDELPSLLNVLMGNMSIVGPRPLVKNQFNMIPDNYKKKIIMLKPGITGIGSLVFRNEEKYLHSDVNDSNDFYKNEIVPFKASLECWYHDNSSIFVDT